MSGVPTRHATLEIFGASRHHAGSYGKEVSLLKKGRLLPMTRSRSTQMPLKQPS